VGRRAPGAAGDFRGLDLEQGKDHGLAVHLGEHSRLFPFTELATQPVVQTEIGGRPIVVVHSVPGGIARAWIRATEAGPVDFEPRPFGPPAELRLRDRLTGSSFDPLTGAAVDGPRAGEELLEISHHPILIDRFEVFFADRS
jgi:hypothetical protein